MRAGFTMGREVEVWKRLDGRRVQTKTKGDEKEEKQNKQQKMNNGEAQK